MNSTSDPYFTLQEWLLFPPRGTTEFYADAAFCKLRAHAGGEPNSHNGLTSVVRQVATFLGLNARRTAAFAGLPLRLCKRSEVLVSALHVAMLQRNEAVPVRVFQSRRQPCTRPLVFANKFSAPMACPKMHEVYLQQIAPQDGKAFTVAWLFVSVCI